MHSGCHHVQLVHRSRSLHSSAIHGILEISQNPQPASPPHKFEKLVNYEVCSSCSLVNYSGLQAPRGSRTMSAVEQEVQVWWEVSCVTGLLGPSSQEVR
jgi:hypothetical protein